MSECPLCREEVKSAAVRCKHCHATSSVRNKTTHDGTCPHCKEEIHPEEIHPEATRYKHCRSSLVVR